MDKLTKAFASTQGELHKLQKQLQDITQVVGQWAQVQATGFQAYAPAPSQGNNYQGQGGRSRGNSVPYPPNQPNNQQFGQDGRGHVLPDINLHSKEVQTSHLGVINITSHKGRDKL